MLAEHEVCVLDFGAGGAFELDGHVMPVLCVVPVMGVHFEPFDAELAAVFRLGVAEERERVLVFGCWLSVFAFHFHFAVLFGLPVRRLVCSQVGVRHREEFDQFLTLE
jgi:hypothetical protein